MDLVVLMMTNVFIIGGIRHFSMGGDEFRLIPSRALFSHPISGARIVAMVPHVSELIHFGGSFLLLYMHEGTFFP